MMLGKRGMAGDRSFTLYPASLGILNLLQDVSKPIALELPQQ
jgi:hypothetical protein